MRQIVTHFTDQDLYSLSVMYYILQNYPRAEVEYQFFDRNKTKYPKGFAEHLRQQMDGMANVVITDEEVDFLKQRCNYFPTWFVDTFLRGYRFNPAEVIINQDEEGYLDVRVKGKWYSTIMWEMPILSTVSELMHIINGDVDNYNAEHEYTKTLAKATKILQSGLTLGDMGTRRRFSFDHHENVIKAFCEAVKINEGASGKFTGTSNVYLAMKYGLPCLGTLSHQAVCFEEIVSGVFECNYQLMDKWSRCFDGNVGIYLYDAFGDDVFFNNLSKRMAMLFNGLRVDSGIEEEQVEKIIAKYQQLGIDPATKQVVFSNGLSVERAIEIHKHVNGRMKDSYGIGTQLTCDVDCGKPMNIVVKLVKGRITESREWHDCVKLSCDKGKTLGNKAKCEYLLSVIGNTTK